MIHGFEETGTKKLLEIDTCLHEMRHVKSGAGLIWLEREDENKTFNITFRTTPWDDSGVFHILEHALLGGSEKYPVKEPFVELMKGSLNTFLNAMTYSDRTSFPVCSRNDKDFLNLINVYMDGVLHPLIYTRPEIFSQEGWHYEFDDDGNISYKGVVYNEMRGAFANPYTGMEYGMTRMLFPDNCYRYISGGDPDAITGLSYEDFKAAHKKFYHPSNAYIVLDGSVDIDAVLKLLDGYLCEYDAADKYDIPQVELQNSVNAGRMDVQYEINPQESDEDKVLIGLGYVFGTYADAEDIVAMRILSDILTGSNHAPLVNALLENDLAQDVSMSVIEGVKQPWVMIQVINASEDNTDAVINVINDTIQKIVSEGIDRELLEASLAACEFAMRERDFGSTPRGLAYTLSVTGSICYGGSPELNLLTDGLFKKLHEGAAGKYFEDILERVIVKNNHKCEYVMHPSYTAGEERRNREKDRILRITSGWDDRTREEYIALQQKLEKWQSSTDTKEALESLPSLAIEDIDDKPEDFACEYEHYKGCDVLLHPINTDGILYVTLYFDIDGISTDNIKILSLMNEIIGNSRTLKHDGSKIQALLRMYCGSLDSGIVSYAGNENVSDSVKYYIAFSALEEKIQPAMELIAEFINDCCFDDLKDIKDIVHQYIVDFRDGVTSSGIGAAMSRVASSWSLSGVVGEYSGGITYYNWLKDIGDNFETEYPKVKACMEALKPRIFDSTRMTVSVTGTMHDCAHIVTDFFAGAFTSGNERAGHELIELNKPAREGIVIPSDVSFAVMGSSMMAHGLRYSERTRLASKIISLDYLWNVVRVKGGAYGTDFQVRENGFTSCYTYRDPDIAGFIKNTDKIGEFLKKFCEECDDITEYIIGAVADMSPVFTPKTKGNIADTLFFRKISYESRCLRRKNLLNARPEDIAGIADALGKCVSAGSMCVVGPRKQLEKLNLDKIYEL